MSNEDKRSTIQIFWLMYFKNSVLKYSGEAIVYDSTALHR